MSTGEERVRALHEGVPLIGGVHMPVVAAYCRECLAPWPCRILRALDTPPDEGRPRVARRPATVDE